MARQKFDKGSEMFELFMDFWKIVQDYWVVENNDAYWESLVTSLDHFSKKYGNSLFARALALALSDELERRYKNESSKS